MELMISVSIMAFIVILSIFFMNKSEKRKVKTVQTLLSSYEKTCKEQCKTTREVTDRFMKVSAEHVGSITELHKKTLELLSGENLHV